MTHFVAWFEHLSGHAAVVAAVGLGFLAVQLLLCIRVFLRAALQERTLESLRSELRLGADGRCEVDDAPRQFGWLRWVLTEFPPASDFGIDLEARFTRDEALHELDVRIANAPAFLMLQRMSVMAPLLGVVLTVLGFYWLDVDDAGDQSLQTILATVTPLVSGVGAGAVLALINQFLLHVAGGRLERLRISAREWFDDVIWQYAGGSAQSAVQSAMVDHQRIAQSFAVLAAQFEQSVEAFQADMKGIPQALRGAREALETSARMLEELAPAATRSVANLDVSVAAFRTTIDREFNDAARLHYRASKILAAAVDDINIAAESLSADAVGSVHASGEGAVPPATDDESTSDDAAPNTIQPR